MYKRITHEIVEEHFDHPAVLPTQLIASANLMYMPSPTVTTGNVHIGLGDRLPQYVMTEATMQFRMDARSAWAKWCWSLLNYSISLNGDLQGTDQVKARMHKNAMALGDFLVPYYGLTAGRELSSALIAIDDIGMKYVEALKDKKSDTELAIIAKLWDLYVTDLAKLLNELNPNNWPEPLVADILTNLVKAWQDQLTARAKKDIAADENAIDTINKIVVTGMPDHNKNGYASLADVFSRGIIAQFPTMFAE